MADISKYNNKAFNFHRVKIEELINGIRITETFDSDSVISFLSHNGKPFLRSTNESGVETYQILDIVGEIYNIPALATDFILIDLKGTFYIPGDGSELVEYSKKLRPFRDIDEDDAILNIGEVTATTNKVVVGLSSTGKNSVRIGGDIYDTYIETDFPFTPVTTGEKILIVYAKPDSQVFHLAQGAESAEAIEPSYNGLFVARILVNRNGAVVTENNDDEFKTKVDDTVYPIIINVETGIWVYARFNTFEVLNNSTATTPILFGLISDGSSATVWNGKRFYIKNSSGKILTLKKEPTPPIVGDTVYFSFSKNITLKDGETIVLFLNRSNELEPLKFIGGSASFPEIGNNGDILVKDSAVDGGVKWSNRLTNAETAITTINGRTSSVVDKMLHYWDATAVKWLSSGVERVFDGIIKVKSIVLTTNSGTALTDELGYDGTNVFFGNTKRKLAFKDDIFEHNVRGKRVELSGVGGTTLNIDLNAGSFFAVTNSGTGNVTMAFTNMIAADESTVINVVVTGNLFTLPAGLIGDSYNDIPNVAKKRKYIFTIEKGGLSPIISYNLINV